MSFELTFESRVYFLVTGRVKKGREKKKKMFFLNDPASAVFDKRIILCVHSSINPRDRLMRLPVDYHHYYYHRYSGET